VARLAWVCIKFPIQDVASKVVVYSEIFCWRVVNFVVMMCLEVDFGNTSVIVMMCLEVDFGNTSVIWSW
jgi:hypothetical protein